jgi:hypothetical protein
VAQSPSWACKATAEVRTKIDLPDKSHTDRDKHHTHGVTYIHTYIHK